MTEIPRVRAGFLGCLRKRALLLLLLELLALIQAMAQLHAGTAMVCMAVLLIMGHAGLVPQLWTISGQRYCTYPQTLGCCCPQNC